MKTSFKTLNFNMSTKKETDVKNIIFEKKKENSNYKTYAN